MTLIIILYENQKINIIHSKILIEDLVGNILIVLIDYLCVAFFEEALFRCALFEGIYTKTNKFVALILCSLIFSGIHFIHYGMGKNSYFEYMNAFLIGILLGLVYIKTNTLMWSIGFHFAWDSFQVLMCTEKGVSINSPISFEISTTNIESYYIISILLISLISIVLLMQMKKWLENQKSIIK